MIVTENMPDFAHVTTGTVLFVRKRWWPSQVLASRMTAALERWAVAHPKPGYGARWMEADVR